MEFEKTAKVKNYKQRKNVIKKKVWIYNHNVCVDYGP